MSEAELLAAARSGDPVAFGRLVGPFRAGLQAHNYRMLGSLHDAEDMLQETLERAWRGLDGFDGRGPIRPWLYKIATNRCLTLIEKRGRRELPTDLGADSEVLWLEPYPDAWLGPEAGYDAREGVELAFVAALQHLSAGQRAALVLREVLGFSAREVADLLDNTVASVNSAVQRARKVLDTRAPSVSQQATLRLLGDDDVRKVAEKYSAAWEHGDVNAIVAMLTEDARYSMPPLPQWYQGHDAIRDWLLRSPLNVEWRFLPARANGQLAFGTYMWDDDLGVFRAAGLDLVELRGTRIAEVVSFLDAAIFPLFGLPVEIAARS